MKKECSLLAALALINMQKNTVPNELCEIIIECDDQANGVCANLNKYGEIKYALPMINAYVMEVPSNKANELKRLAGIKSVHQSAFITAQINTARKVVKADSNYTGKGVTIAFLDTGISPMDDFNKPYNRLAAFYDFVGKSEMPYDDNGHGTHVAYLK